MADHNRIPEAPLTDDKLERVTGGEADAPTVTCPLCQFIFQTNATAPTCPKCQYHWRHCLE